MADRDRPPHQVHVRPQHRHDAGMKTLLPKRGPTANQVVAVITLLPVGGTLLCLAGLIFIGTLIGLALATPLFVIFSPILVPAAITIGLAVTAFVTSGAFGYTGLSTIRRVSGTVPQQLDYAKRSMQEMAVQMGQKTKEMGQAIQSKVQEAGKEGGGRT